jgi:phosphoribosyl 1,2-cyclic phosphate phosphodiesterase
VELARGADLVVLDGLRPNPHRAHMTIDEAVAMAGRIGAPQTYLTHLTHLVGYKDWTVRLPKGVALAYDGLRAGL